MTDSTSKSLKAPRRKARARTPVEQLIPREITEQLRRRAADAPEITADLIHALDDQFALEAAHGLSRRRLRSYLQRLRGEHEPSKGNGRVRPDGQTPGWSDRLRAHRVRQASVASILDATFGKLADCSPDLWGHRAYLMLVGLVYERLAGGEDEIPTGELVALAKIIAENRRVEVRLSDANEKGKAQHTPREPTDRLPENFSDIVRQVYGTNFQGVENGPHQKTTIKSS
jgi:hypothetical protein